MATTMPSKTIVIDFGSHFIKVGYAGECSPRHIFDINSYFVNDISLFETDTVDINIELKPKNLQPFDMSMGNKLKELFKAIFIDILQIKPKLYHVLIIEKMLMAKVRRDTIMTILLKDFQVMSVSMQPDLYMTVLTVGISTGLLINMGPYECQSLAFYQGRPLIQTYRVSPVGVANAVLSFQRQLELFLKKSLPKSAVESLFEKVACVPTNQPNGVFTLDCSDILVYPSEDLANESFTLPGHLRSNCCEIILSGETETDGCMDEFGGLLGLILRSIQSCNVDIRLDVANHLVFCGGGAMIPGLIHAACERANDLTQSNEQYHSLQSLVQKLPLSSPSPAKPYHNSPSTFQEMDKSMSMSKDSNEDTNPPADLNSTAIVGFHPQPVLFLPNLLAWIGGSIFASLQIQTTKFVKVSDVSMYFNVIMNKDLIDAPDWQSLDYRKWKFCSPFYHVDDPASLSQTTAKRIIIVKPPIVKLSPAELKRKLKEVFEDIDADGSGTIDKREFIRAMKYFKIDLTPKEVDLLYERIDQDGNDSIEYEEFTELLGFNIKENTISVQLRKETDALIERLRKDIERELGTGASSARKMKEVFSEIDVDGSNSIDKKEFMKAMKIFRINMMRKELDILFERYDVDKSGTIDYNEFLEVFGFQRAEKEQRISEELRIETDRLIRKLRKDIEREIARGTTVNKQHVGMESKSMDSMG